MRFLGAILFVCSVSYASTDVVQRANDLYERTEYSASLRLLAADPSPDVAVYMLTGKNYFMSGEYKKAVEYFERAHAIAPNSSECELWLGRAWGRRAETGGWMMATAHASKARQHFERAVALDSHNREAKNDLFDFYLNAPGFLGGGLDKAEAHARSIAGERPAESECELAQVAEKRKDYSTAESHLRRAVEFAPAEAGRVVDLARYLAKRGRLKESDELFDRAVKMAPNQPRVLFARASVDVENHHEPERARELLHTYLRASLTPDDPPRQEAEKLLRNIGGSAE